MARWALLLFAGCGRFGFDPMETGQPDVGAPFDADLRCSTETFDTAPATFSPYGPGTALIGNGMLTFSIPGPKSADAGFNSPDGGFTSRSTAVRIVQGPAFNDTFFGIGWHDAQGGKYVHLFVLQGSLQVSGDDGMTFSKLNIPYVPAQHRWLRLRAASGRQYAETSADGSTWTTLVDAPTFMDLVNTRFDIGIDAPVAALPGADSVQFDDYVDCQP